MSLSNINSLIDKASAAALKIITMQNILLDAIDAYQENTQGTSPSARLKRKDMLVSVDELAQLTYQVANQLETWKKCSTPILSSQGFEMNVLNEMALHFTVLNAFLTREKIKTPGYDHNAVLVSIVHLKATNLEVGKCYGDL